MIPANATVEDLKRDYAFVIERGKTMLRVDDDVKWVSVTRFRAICLGRTLNAVSEVLEDKATPEMLAKEEERIIKALKLKIIKMEEEEQTNG